MDNLKKDGFFLIDKEEGWTSRDVCNKIRGRFSFDKVGHSGTLDPFATGLLIVATDKASKTTRFLEEKNKTYIAEIALGKKTTTGDKTGETVLEKYVPVLTDEVVSKVLESFIGKQEQIPPMTSAIHVNGVKLYELAHQGIEVDRPKRTIEIHSLKLIEIKRNSLVIEASVSKGTYMRVLGEDIAERLGTVGYLNSLRRTMVDDISVALAKKISDITLDDLLGVSSMLEKYFIPYVADRKLEKDIKDGKKIKLENCEEVVFLENENREALAILEKTEDNIYKIVRGLW